MAQSIWDLIPTDILVDVLLRLPPSARRRSRLVCRTWRDTVDTHTREMRSRPKTLVATTESLYLIEDDGATVRLWSGDTYRGRASLVGTCNGLLCLCDSTRPGGAITLANPLTGATLAIPPPPLPYVVVSAYWQRTYCFAYHPTTGRYKVVHLQCDFNRAWVFTLGGASWRDVPDDTASSPGARADPNPGIVSVDGTVYWAVQPRGTRTTRPLIMALDLADESITRISLMPYVPPNSNCWNLVAVGARLGIVIVTNSSPALSETEVWIMDHAPDAARSWSCQYVLQIHKPPLPVFWKHDRSLTWPLFSHDGQHIMTMERSRETFSGFVFYKHKLRRNIGRNNHGIVHANIQTNYYPCRTFAYVETTEPLSTYKCW